MNDDTSDLDGLWDVLVASGNGVVTDVLKETASPVGGDSTVLPSGPGTWRTLEREEFVTEDGVIVILEG